VVESVAERHGTTAIARAYLEFLYTGAGQEIAARHFYRPRDAAVAERFSAQFPKLELFTIDELFGGWAKAQPAHFGEGGEFDRLPRGKG
jgi:sulfate transport system substrate-binding protein